MREGNRKSTLTHQGSKRGRKIGEPQKRLNNRGGANQTQKTVQLARIESKPIGKRGQRNLKTSSSGKERGIENSLRKTHCLIKKVDKANEDFTDKTAIKKAMEIKIEKKLNGCLEKPRKPRESIKMELAVSIK